MAGDRDRDLSAHNEVDVEGARFVFEDVGWLLAAGVPDEVCALVSVGSWAEVVAVTLSARPAWSTR